VPFGVYVHIPFCAARCDYCDFATWTDRGHLDRRVRRRVRSDIDAPRADGTRRRRACSSAAARRRSSTRAQLVRILDAIDAHRRRRGHRRVQSRQRRRRQARAYRAAGVNRLSFGVQSMAPHVLAALGRTHDPANVTARVALAREAGSSASTSTSSTERRERRSTTGARRSRARSRSACRTSARTR
jgi:oxygen-independent coproporphyrinogen-3 oxidase